MQGGKQGKNQDYGIIIEEHVTPQRGQDECQKENDQTKQHDEIEGAQHNAQDREQLYKKTKEKYIKMEKKHRNVKIYSALENVFVDCAIVPYIAFRSVGRVNNKAGIACSSLLIGMALIYYGVSLRNEIRRAGEDAAIAYDQAFDTSMYKLIKDRVLDEQSVTQYSRSFERKSAQTLIKDYEGSQNREIDRL